MKAHPPTRQRQAQKRQRAAAAALRGGERIHAEHTQAKAGEQAMIQQMLSRLERSSLKPPNFLPKIDRSSQVLAQRRKQREERKLPGARSPRVHQRLYEAVPPRMQAAELGASTPRASTLSVASGERTPGSRYAHETASPSVASASTTAGRPARHPRLPLSMQNKPGTDASPGMQQADRFVLFASLLSKANPGLLVPNGPGATSFQDGRVPLVGDHVTLAMGRESKNGLLAGQLATVTQVEDWGGVQLRGLGGEAFDGFFKPTDFGAASPSSPEMETPTIDMPQSDGPAHSLGAEVSPTFSAAGEMVATLLWQAPESDGGSPLLQYLVEYRSHVRMDLLIDHSAGSAATAAAAPEQRWEELLTIDSRTQGVEVPNLLPYMAYEFRVRAANIYGYGTPSASHRVNAMVLTPEIDFEAIEPSERNVKFSWLEPVLPKALDGSVIGIERYDVHFREGDSGSWRVEAFPASAEEGKIYGLSPGLLHTVRICGVYATGMGPPSKVHSFTTAISLVAPPRPTMVKAGILRGNLVVSWEVFEAAAAYDVQVESADGMRTFMTRSNCFVVRGLPIGSAQVVQLRARTEEGSTSQWTRPLEVTLLEGQIFETDEMEPFGTPPPTPEVNDDVLEGARAVLRIQAFVRGFLLRKAQREEREEQEAMARFSKGVTGRQGGADAALTTDYAAPGDIPAKAVFTVDYTDQLAAVRQVQELHPGNLAAKFFDTDAFNDLSDELKPRMLAICHPALQDPNSVCALRIMQPSDYDDIALYLDPVVAAIHSVPSGPQKRHLGDWELDDLVQDAIPRNHQLDAADFGLQPLTITVSVRRNFKSSPMASSLTKEQRVQMETDVEGGLDLLLAHADFGGSYKSLTPGHAKYMSNQVHLKLARDGLMFGDLSLDKSLSQAGVVNDWPHGRGCYISAAKDVAIWVGTEDHIFIVCQQTGTLLNDAFRRAEKALGLLQDCLFAAENVSKRPQSVLEHDTGGFAKSNFYGYVTNRPAMTGTGMQASVLAHLPHLNAQTVSRSNALMKPIQGSPCAYDLHADVHRSTHALGNFIKNPGTIELATTEGLHVTESESIASLYTGLGILANEEAKGEHEVALRTRIVEWLEPGRSVIAEEGPEDEDGDAQDASMPPPSFVSTLGLLSEWFDAIDVNHDGDIQKEEAVVMAHALDESWSNLKSNFDTDGDEEISREEFYVFFLFDSISVASADDSVLGSLARPDINGKLLKMLTKLKSNKWGAEWYNEALVQIILARRSNPHLLGCMHFDILLLKQYNGEMQERLLSVCKAGFENPEDCDVGVYLLKASDYTDLEEYLEKIVHQHSSQARGKVHPRENWDPTGMLGVPDNLQFDMPSIGLPKLAMEASIRRNFSDLPLAPGMTLEDRISLEERLHGACKQLIASPAFGGQYMSLTPGHKFTMPPELHERLLTSGVMFKDTTGDPELASAGVASDWPHGRGCYVSETGDVTIWVGVEDHLQLFVRNHDGTSMNDVFDRIQQTMTTISHHCQVKLATSAHFGYLTSSPVHVGTGMHASTSLYLPNLLAKGMGCVSDIVDGLYSSSTAVVDASLVVVDCRETKPDTVQLSPQRTFAIQEREVLRDLYRGAQVLLAEERALGGDTSFREAYAAKLLTEVAAKRKLDEEKNIFDMDKMSAAAADVHIVYRFDAAELLKEWFIAMDADGDGFIDRDEGVEMAQMLGDSWEGIVAEIDENSDGRLSLDEFSGYFLNSFLKSNEDVLKSDAAKEVSVGQAEIDPVLMQMLTDLRDAGWSMGGEAVADSATAVAEIAPAPAAPAGDAAPPAAEPLTEAAAAESQPEAAADEQAPDDAAAVVSSTEDGSAAVAAAAAVEAPAAAAPASPAAPTAVEEESSEDEMPVTAAKA